MSLAPHHIAAVAAGADCTRCPLHDKHQGPVPPRVNPAGPVEFLVVGEAPGPAEVDDGEPFVGPSGREVKQALAEGGMDPSRASYTNAILCRPIGGDLEDYLRECKKRGLPSPIECCKPRLQRELARAEYSLFVGGAAVKAAGVGDAILKLRGTPLVQRPGLATLHPAFVLRDQGRLMRRVFRFDIAKAVRLSRGGNTWRDPEYAVVPSSGVSALDFAFLAGALRYFEQQPLIAVDTETNGIDPWTCAIRRIGIGAGDKVLIWSPLSVHGTGMVNEREWNDHCALLAQFFAKPLPFVFHNFYGYDSIVLNQHGMPVNETNVFDSLIGHHIGPTSELPHALDFLASIYTDAPRWKDDVKHSNTRDDGILDRYLSFDVATTWLSAPHVKAAITASAQEHIYSMDVALSRAGRSMSAVGVRIDSSARRAFALEYEAKAEKLKAEFVEAAGREVNPASYPQVRKLLYEDLGLPILSEHLTDTGEPSTAEPVLLDLLARGVDDRTRTILYALLGWRETDKLLGTYTGRMRGGDIEGGYPQHTDSRIRTAWKVLTTSGRWASSPNLQNVPDKLRLMFVPDAGHVFVAADYSAVELRITALLANDEALIRAFDEFDRGVGPDIHTVNACVIFRCTPDKVTKEVRTFAKRFIYALSYGAEVETIFQTMSLLRNEDLTPVFPGIVITDIQHAMKVWWEAHSALKDARRKLIASWRKNGYIASPWHGRRRYFLGGENHQEMYDYPPQSGAADLQNSAVLKVAEKYPFDYSERLGLVLQVHDQLVIECRENEAERVKTLLIESMQTQVGPMRFPVEAKIGRNWKAVS